jgi:hypothetical protein
MDPLILGAIIGAVPGSLAAGLSTWAAVRAGKINLSQTRLTLATEHQQWLRDKRSELYVDLLFHAEQLYLRRQAIICSSREIIEADRQEVVAIVNEYRKNGNRGLVAQADAYAPKDTARAFTGMVCLMDFGFWAMVYAAVDESSYSRFKMDGYIETMLNFANEGLAILRELISRDLQITPLSNPVSSVAEQADVYGRLRELVQSSRSPQADYKVNASRIVPVRG